MERVLCLIILATVYVYKVLCQVFADNEKVANKLKLVPHVEAVMAYICYALEAFCECDIDFMAISIIFIILPLIHSMLSAFYFYKNAKQPAMHLLKTFMFFLLFLSSLFVIGFTM